MTADKSNGEGLSTPEVDALKKYSAEDATSNGEKYYVRLNKALRKFIKADFDQYEGIIKSVSACINKLRSGSSSFYRYSARLLLLTVKKAQGIFRPMPLKEIL